MDALVLRTSCSVLQIGPNRLSARPRDINEPSNSANMLGAIFAVLAADFAHAISSLLVAPRNHT